MQATRILIIEDDDGSRNALTEVLRYEGFEVCGAASGEAGVRMLAEFQPQFAIIDVHLPDANGIELMREIRKLQPECACLVASGSASFTTRDGAPMMMDFSQEADEAGAIGYFCKPIDVDLLLETLGGLTR
jgi:DNA-binding response OmpR family regulator